MKTATRIGINPLILTLALTGTARAGLLSAPEAYTPEKSWPVVVSTQSAPSREVMAKTPFFLVHEGGMGVEVSNKIRNSLRQLAGRYNIDPLRIYATSFSRGGQEILIQATQFPDRFAAIAPVGHDLRPNTGHGRLMIERVQSLRIPVLKLCGEGDGFRRTGQALYESMKAAGVPVTWSTYPGGHDPAPVWNTEHNQTWLDFFAAHRLDPYPKTVGHWVDHKRYSRAFWVDATLVRDEGNAGGHFVVRVLEDNRIEVEANEKIAALDLFLNEHIVAMDRPVTVISGEETLYEGPAVEKVSIVLREGASYYQARVKPLWEEIEEIRQQSGWMAELRRAGKDGSASALGGDPDLSATP